MSFPSFFALLFAPALRRRRGRLRWLPAFAFALAALAGSSMAQAANHRFDGKPAAACTLADKTYTCPPGAWLGESDTLLIDGGYTLKITGSLTLGYDHGLTMDAASKLVVTGDLDIRGVKPANLKVANGSAIEAGGSFSMGDLKQTLSADIAARTMQLGPGRVTLNGKLSALDTIAIGAQATINDDISAAVITTAPGVSITGKVAATASFSLASGGKVKGGVDTGSLVLESSEALIDGSAWVDTARLEWHGRVSGTIYCKRGTPPDSCDCVTNNSGYEVDSQRGPTCEGAPANGVHHYLIAHDGQASSCAGEPVTVTACANAGCSAPHAATAPATSLEPGGAGVSFGSSGVAQVELTSIQSGSITLGLATAAPVACIDTRTGSASCAMTVSDKTSFEILVPDHRAGEVQAATLQALKPSSNRKACVPAFKEVTVNLGFSCAHETPASGRDYLHLDEKGKLSETSAAPLACGGMAAGAAPTTKQVAVAFDAGGTGAVSLRYGDVGAVRLKASYTGSGGKIEGEGLFTAVPYRFGLAAGAPPGGFVAGDPFVLTLSSLNKAGGVTRGFDSGLLPGATAVALGSCALAPLRSGSVSPLAAAGFQQGVASVQVSWSEVGSMDLNASLGDFLGTGMASTGSSGDCKGLGPFVPAFLQVERDPALPARSFDYSGEPIHVVVSARNRQGEITQNYEQATGRSEDVALAAVVSAGGPGAWASAPTTVPAASFSEGKASWSRAYLVGKDVKPAALAIRATSATATSKDKGENLQTEVRLGRLRLGSRFGGLKATLSIPVTAEYWTGKSWLLNSDDHHTRIPQGAFAFRPAAGLTPTPAFAPGPLGLAGGAAAFGLRVGAGGPGPVDIAVNLGSGTQDDACIGASAGTGVATLGAAMPWLRPFTTGCNTAQARDPYGRASFGVYTPENRRVIHVREVFQ